MKNKQIFTVVEEIKGLKLRRNCTGEFFINGVALLIEKLLWEYEIPADKVKALVDEIAKGEGK